MAHLHLRGKTTEDAILNSSIWTLQHFRVFSIWCSSLIDAVACPVLTEALVEKMPPKKSKVRDIENWALHEGHLGPCIPGQEQEYSERLAAIYITSRATYDQYYKFFETNRSKAQDIYLRKSPVLAEEIFKHLSDSIAAMIRSRGCEEKERPEHDVVTLWKLLHDCHEMQPEISPYLNMTCLHDTLGMLRFKTQKLPNPPVGEVAIAIAEIDRVLKFLQPKHPAVIVCLTNQQKLAHLIKCVGHTTAAQNVIGRISQSDSAHAFSEWRFDYIKFKDMVQTAQKALEARESTSHFSAKLFIREFLNEEKDVVGNVLAVKTTTPFTTFTTHGVAKALLNKPDTALCASCTSSNFNPFFNKIKVAHYHSCPGNRSLETLLKQRFSYQQNTTQRAYQAHKGNQPHYNRPATERQEETKTKTHQKRKRVNGFNANAVEGENDDDERDMNVADDEDQDFMGGLPDECHEAMLAGVRVVADAEDDDGQHVIQFLAHEACRSHLLSGIDVSRLIHENLKAFWILDSGADIMVISERFEHLLTNLTEVRHKTGATAAAGKLVYFKQGEHPLFPGIPAFVTNSKFNLLPTELLLAHGCRLFRDDLQQSYVLWNALAVWTFRVDRARSPKIHSLQLVTTEHPEPDMYSLHIQAAERETQKMAMAVVNGTNGATVIQRFHDATHLSERGMRLILQHNLLENLEVDKNAVGQLYHSIDCIGCTHARAVKLQHSSYAVKDIAFRVGATWFVDTQQKLGEKFLFVADAVSQGYLIIPLNSFDKDELLNTSLRFASFFVPGGVKLQTIYADSLSSFSSMTNNGHFKVITTPAGAHNQRAELFWRHLCTMTRALVFNVSFELSPHLLMFALRHAAVMSWFRPVAYKEGVSTPWCIWKGIRPDARWPIFQVAWGTVGLYHKAHAGHLQYHESNLDAGIFLFSTLESPSVMQVLSLTTGKNFQSRKLQVEVHRDSHMRMLAKLHPGVKSLDYEMKVLHGADDDVGEIVAKDTNNTHGSMQIKTVDKSKKKASRGKSNAEINLARHLQYDDNGMPYMVTPMINVVGENNEMVEDKVDTDNVSRQHVQSNFNPYAEHSLKRSLKAGGLGEKATDAAIKEINTIFLRGAFIPMRRADLTAELVKEAADTRILIKVKKADDSVKGRWICDHSRFLRAHPDQREYNPTPTPDAMTLKLLLAHGYTKRMKLIIWDARSAFLNADFPLDRMAKVKEPELSLVLRVKDDWLKFVTTEHYGTKAEKILYLKIVKAVYGNPEANLLWFLTLTTFLNTIGFMASPNDRSMYYLVNEMGEIVMVIHVDDGMTFVSNDTIADWFVDKMEAQFGSLCIQRGPHYIYCSLEIEQLKDFSFRIRQVKHLEKLLAKYCITKQKKAPSRVDLYKRNASSPRVESKMFLRMLMAAAWQQHSRPQIAVTISILAARATTPTEEDMEDVKHLLEYLNHVKLRYFNIRPNSMTLSGWADAAWSTHPDGTSQSGVMLCLGTGPDTTVVMVKSIKQKVVAQSSTEGEIYACHSCNVECAWAREILEFLGHPQSVINIYQDNKSCITMMQKGGGTAKRTKHINVKFFSIQNEVIDGRMALVFKSSACMRADPLTKPAVGSKFEMFEKYCLNEKLSQEQMELENFVLALVTLDELELNEDNLLM